MLQRMVCSINSLEAYGGIFQAILQDTVLGWHCWLAFKVALEVFAPPAPRFVVGPVCVF